MHRTSDLMQLSRNEIGIQNGTGGVAGGAFKSGETRTGLNQHLSAHAALAAAGITRAKSPKQSLFIKVVLNESCSCAHN
jgi:hypothetical protein